MKFRDYLIENDCGVETRFLKVKKNTLVLTVTCKSLKPVKQGHNLKHEEAIHQANRVQT